MAAALVVVLLGDGAAALWQAWKEQLLMDEVAQVLDQARERAAKLSGPTAEPADKQIGYFEHNQSRRLHGTYRALGFFMVLESSKPAVKASSVAAAKARACFGPSRGATHVLDLRCALYGNQFDQVWDKLNQSDYLRIRLLEQPDQAEAAA